MGEFPKARWLDNGNTGIEGYMARRVELHRFYDTGFSTIGVEGSPNLEGINGNIMSDHGL